MVKIEVASIFFWDTVYRQSFDNTLLLRSWPKICTLMLCTSCFNLVCENHMMIMQDDYYAVHMKTTQHILKHCQVASLVYCKQTKQKLMWPVTCRWSLIDIIWICQRRCGLDAVESSIDSNSIRGRWNCCGARPVGVRTDFQLPHWQSAQRPFHRCRRCATWAFTSTQTWWCALTYVRQCRAALQHCVSCAAFVT